MRCTGPWPMRWSRLRPAPISASWCCAPRARSSPPATIWASLPPSHATRDRRCARWSASCAIWLPPALRWSRRCRARRWGSVRSEEHTSELQSRPHLVCRLLLEKKKKINIIIDRLPLDHIHHALELFLRADLQLHSHRTLEDATPASLPCQVKLRTCALQCSTEL